MSNVATIMWLTFHEARRRKMVLAALVLGLLFIVLYVVGFLFIVYEAKLIATGVAQNNALGPNRQLLQAGQDVGLNFLTMAGLYVVHFLTIMLAIFASVDTVAGEISSHTIQAIATKPVRRW
ncbi:MAG TPA: ABC transporter permease subunit, partial [Chloroflexia bacterium]